MNLILEILLAYVISSSISAIILYSIRNSIKNRIEAWLWESLTSYVHAQIDDIRANPQKTAEILRPLMAELVKEFMNQAEKGAEKQLKPIKVFGLPIPRELVYSFIQRYIPLGNNQPQKPLNPWE